MGVKKSKAIKGCIMILVVALLMSTVSTAFAAQKFTDVTEDHWAKEYIEKVHELGIIKGDEDFATFRPNEKVKYIDGIVMISRLLEVEEELVNKAIEINKDFLDEMKISEENRKGVAIAIATGIVSKDVLKATLEDDSTENISKVDVCIFLTRAMNLEDDAQSKQLVVLPFKDFDLIPDKAAAYVEVMIEEGIIAKEDVNGDSIEFKPESTVSRAVMAKMLALGYDYIQENDVDLDIDEDNLDGEDKNIDEDEVEDSQDKEKDTDEKQEQEEKKEEKTFKITGVITGTLNTKDIINIKIRQDNGQEGLYQASSDAEATLDGEGVDILDLTEGAVIEAKVTENNRIMEIDATSYEDQFIGRVSSVSNVLAPFIIIETEIDSKTKKKGFYGTEDLVVMLNGEEVEIVDLEEGDAVDLKTKDEEVVKIIAESKNREFSGMLQKVDFDGQPFIEIKDNKDNIREFKLDDNTEITRNGKSVHFIDLRIGDDITLYTEYDRVIEVKAKVVKTEVEGTISSIIIANTSKIKVTNEDGEEKTYIISNDSDIKVDGKYKSIYDLRLGHQVKLELEGNVVFGLTAEKIEQESRFMGELMYINKESRVIMIKTDDGEKKMINTTQLTSYIDVDGMRRNIDWLNIGDELLVVCRYDGVTFIAKNIIIMEQSDK